MSSNKTEWILNENENSLFYYLLENDDRPWYIPDQIRWYLFDKAKFQCQICGISGWDRQLEIDHVIPVSKGGKAHLNNLQVLCKECNRIKSGHFLHMESYIQHKPLVVYVEEEWRIRDNVLEAIERDV